MEDCVPSAVGVEARELANVIASNGHHLLVFRSQEGDEGPVGGWVGGWVNELFFMG